MDWLTYAFYRVCTIVIALLPLPVGVRMGRWLGASGYWLAPTYRRVALRNLGIAFPEKTPADRRAMARQHFASLVGNLFASQKLATLSKEQLLPLIDTEGMEVLQKLTAEKRGFVLVICHLGNWELLAQISPLTFGVPCGTVYQTLGNRHIDAHIRRTRGRLGLALFERKEGFNDACEMLRAGGGVGVLADQHAGDAGVWCPLFGRLASSSPMAAMLALRARVPLVPLAMYTDGAGRWKFIIQPALEPASTDVGEVTAQLNVAIEQLIRHQPTDWFWVHNRWKTPNPKFLLATYKRGIAFAPGAPTPTLQPFRIVIRSSNWLGDAVMSVPAVRAIKRGRPDVHLTILCPAKLVDIWRLLPEVDEIIPLHPPARGVFRIFHQVTHFLRLATTLRSRQFEAAVVFPNSLRTALEVWLPGIPRRVGFPGHAPRTWFLNQVVREKSKKKKEPEHQVNHYLAIARRIGAETDAVPFADTTGWKPVEPLRIAVCPGAEYGGAKRWLPERYAAVIQEVGLEGEWTLVGTAKDRPIAEEIALAAARPNIRNLCGQTTLAELIAHLRGCRLLLTNDTGTMHLATLLGVPTVSIFGSTEPVLTGPLGTGHVVLRHKVECSPCFLRECPIDFRCMKAIEVAEVVAAVRLLMASSLSAPCP